MLAVTGGTLVTWPGQGPVRGDALSRPEIVENATVVCDGDRIVSIGGDVPSGADIVDATGKVVTAGFVDCHTHLPFYGWRGDEDAARLNGVRYEDLHGQEGGIFRSARSLAEAPDEEVLAFSAGLAGRMLRTGTTTLEMKSGYGLSVEAELRQLRLAKELAGGITQLTTATCLAAHAIPPGKSQGEWIGEAANELLPEVSKSGLATACDIYVETIAFALEHAARLSEVAVGLGLRMRVHADQLSDNQTGAFAARWGFATADHLNHTSPDGAGDLAASDTVAVLLPGATFTLKQTKKPPARQLLDEGAIVALATDLNPGTSPISSIPLVIALACRTYGFAPLEALAAVTVNGAYALGLDAEVGRTAPGMRADLVVLDLPSIEQIAYRPDADLVTTVISAGRVVYLDERPSS